MGPSDAFPEWADMIVDAAGEIALPGFVNTHHHLNQTLTRELSGAQNNNLSLWLAAHYRIRARPNRRPRAPARRWASLIRVIDR